MSGNQEEAVAAPAVEPVSLVPVSKNKKPKKKKKEFRRASRVTKFVTFVSNVDRSYLVWCQGMLFFDKSEMDFTKFKTILTQRLLPIGRMHSRYDFKRHGFEKLDEDEIDMDYHFTEINDEISLKDVANTFMGDVYANKKVDFDKPLWFAQFFPNLNGDFAGKSLAVISICHTIGDGVSLVELVFKLMDQEPLGVEEGVTIELEDVDEIKAVKDKETLLRPAGRRKVKNTYGPLNKAKIFMGGVAGAFTSALSSPDSTTALSRPNMKIPSRTKKFAFTPQISLDDVKYIKNKVDGATVNDVLVALLNCIMIEYLKSSGLTTKQLGRKKLRAGFPMNVRSKNEPILKEDGSPSNKFAFGMFQFFTNYNSRISLIHSVKARIDRIKLSPYPIVQLRLGSFLGKVMTKKAHGQLLLDFVSQTTAQLSNVAGPQQEVKFGGARVLDLQFGLYSVMGIYLGLISYDNKVSCCICMDESIGDPEDLAKYWQPEFDAMLQETKEVEGVAKKPKKWNSFMNRI